MNEKGQNLALGENCVLFCFSDLLWKLGETPLTCLLHHSPSALLSPHDFHTGLNMCTFNLGHLTDFPGQQNAPQTVLVPSKLSMRLD